MTFEARIVNEPRPGYFRMRAVRNGPLVPARIWATKKGALRAHINGTAVEVDRVWTWGKEITAEEFRRLMGRKIDATAICDLNTMPSQF